MNASRRFLGEIHERVLIGDGAIGTELFARGAAPANGIERLNLIAPDMVSNLHSDYIDAGSRVIETNTFAASAPALARFGAEHESRQVIRAGVNLARKAAKGHDVYVAGSVGPLPIIEGNALSLSEKESVFRDVVDNLLDGGVDLLLFETFSDLGELAIAVSYARQITELPIVAQMAFEEGGLTAGGDTVDAFVRRMIKLNVDVVGSNCGGGVPPLIDAITKMRAFSVPLSAFFNAGFPEDIEGRKIYLATPHYLAKRACHLVDLGVRLIGGCCGTRPETIKAIASAVHEHCKTSVRIPVIPEPVRLSTIRQPPLSAPEELQIPSETLVELDPPKGIDAAGLLEAVHALKQAGIKTITIADNPLASACADVIATAGIVMRETELRIIPHLTGRDRNRIALQSSIMGAHLLGIRSILCVTGDPVRMYHETDTTGVFNLVSVSLVKLVSEFNAGRRGEGGPTAFSIGVAFNPHVKKIETQILKLKKKISAGAHFVLTQPIFDPEVFDTMHEAFSQASITIPVFAGILPLRSLTNAEFLHNEVPGIDIPEAIRNNLARYKDLKDQTKVGTDIALDLMDRFRPHVHGFYLISPKNRVEMVLPLIAAEKGKTL